MEEEGGETGEEVPAGGGAEDGTGGGGRQKGTPGGVGAGGGPKGPRWGGRSGVDSGGWGVLFGDHINGHKHDNNLSNLEILTPQQHYQRRRQQQPQPRPKPKPAHRLRVRRHSWYPTCI